MARRKHYKNEGIIKFLVIIAGILALVTVLFSLIGYYYLPVFIYPYWVYGSYRIVYLIIGLVVAVFTIIMGMRKTKDNGEEIIPLHWISILIFAILVIVFGGGLLACILLIIAFLIALIEDL